MARQRAILLRGLSALLMGLGILLSVLGIHAHRQMTYVWWNEAAPAGFTAAPDCFALWVQMNFSTNGAMPQSLGSQANPNPGWRFAPRLRTNDIPEPIYPANGQTGSLAQLRWHLFAYEARQNGAERMVFFRYPLPVVMCLIAGAWLVWRSIQRHPPGCCSRCGYDLRAGADRCPECGYATKQDR